MFDCEKVRLTRLNNNNNYTILYNLGNFRDAEKYHLQSLKRRVHKLKTEDHFTIGSCHNNLGVLYDQMRDHKKALFHHKKGLEIKIRTKAPENTIIISLGNVAMQESVQGSVDAAISHLEDALQRLEKTTPQPTTAYFSTLRNYGIVLRRQGNYRKAVGILEKTLAVREQNNATHTLAYLELLLDTGQVYQKLNNHHKALKNFHRVIDLKDKANSRPKNMYIYQAYRGLFEEYSALRNIDQSEDAYAKTCNELQRLQALSASDERFSLELQNGLSKLKASYENFKAKII